MNVADKGWVPKRDKGKEKKQVWGWWVAGSNSDDERQENSLNKKWAYVTLFLDLSILALDLYFADVECYKVSSDRQQTTSIMDR